VSQPLDRTQQCEQLGAVDTAAGEFWVTSPFQMPQLGHNLSAYEENRLFLNVHGEKFLDASFTSHANIDSDSRSVIVGDWNADGAPDMLVGNVGGGPLRMFLNRIPTTDYHKVRLQLVGTTSNRQGIGSRVTLRCGPQSITRDLFPANGFLGQNPVELLVGVGAAAVIDELVVRWPTGQVQSWQSVPVDRCLQITEGAGDYATLNDQPLPAAVKSEP
jgi:hypothetical protein